MDSSTSLNEYFELQLSEIEMLTSMYPGTDEINISFPSVLVDMNRYVSGESKYIPNQLDFTLKLNILDIKDNLEIIVCFPHKYPFLKPEVYVRSAGLNRSQQNQLNLDMTKYLQTLESGEPCMLVLINWLTENAGSYFTSSTQIQEDCTKQKSEHSNDSFCRMWIYSHHIYNKFKRKEIVDSGEELNLTGFSLPGKPGFICVEGYKKDCNEFLQNLKQMSWKKISLVREETEEVSSDVDIKEFRKFDSFGEISFQVRRGPAREYHMDMGQFLKYLTDHDCAYAFQDLFGLEGQVSAEK